MALLARDVAAWALPLVVCYLARPLLCRRRAYIVAAAVLCLTPMFVHYRGMDGFVAVWPLVLCLPAYILLLPESLKGLLYMGLPLGSLVGVVAWFWSGRILHRRNVS